MGKINYEVRADDWAIGEQPKAKRPRKPSLKRAVKAAEKATGKPVTSVTLPDGTKLGLGEGAPTDAPNPWLLDREGKARQ
jgi:hypothetical protein